DRSWWARVVFTDPDTGLRRERVRRAINKTDAKAKRKDLLRDLEDHGPKLLDAYNMTFKDLADFYGKSYLVPAQYVDGRKIAGLRSLKTPKMFLRVLTEHFGKRRLRSMTHADIEGFRSARIGTPTRSNKQRSITSVNRELELLRRMLNVAVREGWLSKSPFSSGECLISKADERKRERIISRDEEERLLVACGGYRAHLRPILITALDTGMRRGEILKLTWSDVDIENRIITVRAFNTKNMRERQVSMTCRLARELEAIYGASTKDP